MTRLQLMLELERDELPCEGDVVRHVSEEQARAWGMSPGFALQFVGTTPAVRDALEALRTGKPPPSEAQDDPQAEALLSRHRAAGEDPYALLGVPEDVPCAEAKARARELVRELDSLGARPLSVRQTREQLHLLAELHEAGERLGVPQQRLEVDLARGNWRGIARALAAGLTAGELERARETWLIRNGGVESRSRIHLATAQAWESRGAHEQALIEYARALAADPANLTLHQRHAQLLRLQGGAPQGRA
jgi:serine/threonine-protein kinase